MHTVTAAYLDALRGPHNAYGYVEAWYGGVPLEVDGSTRLPLTDGSVDVDGATDGVRRTLSAAFAPVDGLFDLLAPTGTELHAYTVLRHLTGVEEAVPQGVFDIDAQRVGYAANGDIKVTAPDRWARVQRARFLTPRASSAGVTIRAQIIELLLEALPAGSDVTDLGTSTATVPAQVWDRDRDKTIQDLAKAAALDVYFDRTGAPTIRDTPTLNSEAVVWTVDAGDGGVMIDAERERNRQRTYNLVVVNGDANDGATPPPTQFVWDAAPGSPTYAGPDPVNHPELAGPFGVRPTFYTSPLITTVSQALVAGHTILERVQGLATQLSLTAVPNPALDDGDTILVKLPIDRPGGAHPLELHIVDRLSVPLLPSRQSQAIATRSTLVGYEGAE